MRASWNVEQKKLRDAYEKFIIVSMSLILKLTIYLESKTLLKQGAGHE